MPTNVLIPNALFPSRKYIYRCIRVAHFSSRVPRGTKDSSCRSFKAPGSS